jgi:hypothetical protein
MRSASIGYSSAMTSAAGTGGIAFARQHAQRARVLIWAACVLLLGALGTMAAVRTLWPVAGVLPAFAVVSAMAAVRTARGGLPHFSPWTFVRTSV